MKDTHYNDTWHKLGSAILIGRENIGCLSQVFKFRLDSFTM
jgi:hypothetical protein